MKCKGESPGAEKAKTLLQTPVGADVAAGAAAAAAPPPQQQQHQQQQNLILQFSPSM
jgi:hypothetical protein